MFSKDRMKKLSKLNRKLTIVNVIIMQWQNKIYFAIATIAITSQFLEYSKLVSIDFTAQMHTHYVYACR